MILDTKRPWTWKRLNLPAWCHAHLLLQVSDLSQDGSGVLDGLDQLITVLQTQDGAMRPLTNHGLTLLTVPYLVQSCQVLVGFSDRLILLCVLEPEEDEGLGRTSASP